MPVRHVTALALLLLAACGGSPRPVGLTPTPHAVPLVARAPGTDFRVLSWNISGTRALEQGEHFRALLRAANPDIVVLDEYAGDAPPERLLSVVRLLRGAGDTTWRITRGAGGGYQRGLIATRLPHEVVPNFEQLPYPDSAVADWERHTTRPDSAWLRRNALTGMPFHGTIVPIAGRRALVVSVDFWCCSSPDHNWQERRRVLEARTLRDVTARVLDSLPVDGVILAGDLNTVSGAVPLAILTGPYPPPHHGLVAVEARHLVTEAYWTWDGRGTRFPSGTLDWALYTPRGLEVLRAFVLDSEDLPADVLSALGIAREASSLVSDHRPLVVDYRWR